MSRFLEIDDGVENYKYNIELILLETRLQTLYLSLMTDRELDADVDLQDTTGI